MREKLNENPAIQAAVIGVLALFVGFMIFRAITGPKAGTEQPDLSTVPGSPTATAPAPAGDATATPPAGAATAAPEVAPPAGATEVPPPAAGAGGNNGSEFVAGPGLPKGVAAAYDQDKVVALLIVRGPAIDDRRLMPMVAGLRSRGDTAVFIVKAFDVAKYSRIASGVNVDRTPALVVIQPKHLTRGPMPTATVSYGYRGRQSVDQAVRDALYNGRDNIPYYPEK